MSAIPALQFAPSPTSAGQAPVPSISRRTSEVSQEAFAALCLSLRKGEAAKSLEGRTLDLDQELLEKLPETPPENIGSYVPELNYVTIQGNNLTFNEAMKAFKLIQTVKTVDAIYFQEVLFKEWPSELLLQAKGCFSKMKSLGLDDCKLDDPAVESLFSPEQTLRSVSLTEENQITDLAVIHILQTCQNLKTLSLFACSGLTDRLISHLPTHETLISIELLDIPISDQGLQKLAEDLAQNRLPQLRRLDLSFCENITTQGINAIRKSRPNLKLETMGCPNVSEELEDASQNSSASNKDLVTIPRLVPRNPSDSSSSNQKEGHISEGDFASLCDQLKNGQTPAPLDGTQIAFNLQTLSNLPVSHIENLPKYLPSLKFVTINCKDLPAEGFIKAFKIVYQFKAIDDISITNAPKPWSRNLANHAAQSFEQLNTLFLGSCHLDDANMKQLMAKAKNLQNLALYWTHKITDESLKAVANSCPKLVRVVINDCFLITDKGIQTLLTKYPNLDLTISNCPKISKGLQGKYKSR